MLAAAGVVSLETATGLAGSDDGDVRATLRYGSFDTYRGDYPNSIWGYGTLCLAQTFDLLKEYTNGGAIL